MNDIVASGEGWSKTLDLGAEYSIGRSGLDDAPDLSLGSDDRIHRICGFLIPGERSWELRNTGRWLSLTVSDLDGPGSDAVAPGGHLIVSWPRCRIDVDLGDVRPGFECVRSSSDVPAADYDIEGTMTVPAARIDRTTGYFRVLVAMCEPQLLDPSGGAVPTDAQIVARLNRSGVEERRISAKTVERRLDSCRERLGLKSADGFAPADGRRRLVEVALRTGLVGVDDLVLLDPSGDGTGGQGGGTTT